MFDGLTLNSKTSYSTEIAINLQPNVGTYAEEHTCKIIIGYY